MNFMVFIKIFKKSFKNALLKAKNDNDFHKVLGITYSISKITKKNKKN